MVRTRTIRPSCSVYVASSSWCMLFHGHDVAAMDKTATHGDPSHSCHCHSHLMGKIPRVACRIPCMYATSMAASLVPWRNTPSPTRHHTVAIIIIHPMDLVDGYIIASFTCDIILLYMRCYARIMILYFLFLVPLQLEILNIKILLFPSILLHSNQSIIHSLLYIQALFLPLRSFIL